MPSRETNLPPSDPNQPDPLKRLRRRRRIWFLVKLFVVLIILLLGLLLYLQTNHALQNFYLPLAGKSLGMEIRAEGGSAHLSGALELINPVVMGTDGVPAFSANLVVLKASPASLLPGKLPVIEEARLVNPAIRMRVGKDGATNWDFKPGAGKKRDSAVQPEQRKRAGGNYPNIRIGDLQISQLRFDYADAGGLEANIDNVELRAKNLERGQKGSFNLQADAKLDRPEQKIKQTGKVKAEGNLAQDASGHELKWDGRLTASIQSQSPSTGVQKVDIKADYEGSANVSGKYDQKFNLAANTPQGPAGQFKGNIVWEPEKQARQATLNITNVTREFLNPLIAAIAPLEMTRSNINADLRLNGQGDVVSIETDIQARDLAFRAGRDNSLTPVMDLLLKQRGNYNIKTSDAQLGEILLTLQQNNAPVIQAQLDKLITVNLSASAGAKGLSGQTAQIRLLVNGLDAKALQPWLALAGVDQSAGLRGGAFNGNVVMSIDQSGQNLGIEGNINGTKLTAAQWNNQPLEVRQVLRARLEKMKQLNIEQMVTSVDALGQKAADIEISGGLQLEQKQGTMQIKLTSPAAFSCARLLGLNSSLNDSNFRDGRLELAQTLTILPSNKGMSVEGSARADGMALLSANGQAVPLNFSAKNKLALGNQRLTIEPLRIEFSQQAMGKVGVMEIKGQWPAGSLRKEKGELKFTIRDFDLAPWLRTLQGLQAESLPPSLALDADETAIMAENGTSKWTGELRVGPWVGEGQNLSVTLRNEIEKAGETLQRLVLDFASRVAGGAGDKVLIQGSAQLGDSHVFKAEAKIDSLNLDPYLALVGSKKNGERSDQTAKTNSGQATPSAPEDVAQKPPKESKARNIMDVDLDIKRFVFRGNELTGAKGNLRSDHGATTLKLTEGQLNGGALNGNAELDSSKLEPRYAWNMSLKNAQMQRLAAILGKDWNDKLSGTADIQSRGTGQGSGEAAKRRLQSETSFMIQNGELKNFFLLEVLAQQTRVAEFKDLRFFEFTGQINLADGVATLKDWNERGQEQTLSMDGTVNLNGQYKLLIQPSVKGDLVKQVAANEAAARLLSDEQGFFRLPFQVAISGQGKNYRAQPQVGISTTAGKSQDAVRGALGGLLGQKLQNSEEKRIRQLDQQSPAQKPVDQPSPVQKPLDQSPVQKPPAGLFSQALDTFTSASKIRVEPAKKKRETKPDGKRK